MNSNKAPAKPTLADQMRAGAVGSGLISKAPPPITPLRGGQRPPEKSKDTPPDLDYWSQRDYAAPYEAVAITCNIDPRRGRFAEWWGKRSQFSSPSNKLEYKPFSERLEIVESSKEYSGHVRVEIRPFMQWAARKKWADVPPIFLSTQGPSADPGTSVADQKQAPAITRHVLKARTHVLDAEIEAAKANATDPQDVHSVWVALKQIALEEKGPFTGEIGEKGSLAHDRGDRVEYFKKSDLRKRMNR